MPDLSELKDFIKMSELEEGDIVFFVNAGEIKEIDFSKTQDGSKKQKAYEAIVSVNGGYHKKMVLNNTTVNHLSSKWGNKTEAWVGGQVKVVFIKSLSFGKILNVAMLDPMEGAFKKVGASFMTDEPKGVKPEDKFPNEPGLGAIW